MYKKYFDNTPLWQFEIFSSDKTIKHFVSGREGGLSKGEKGALNVSYNVGDDPENVRQNRTILAEAMQVEVANLVFPQLTHSNNVVHIERNYNQETIKNTDAIITNTSGICLVVTAADCVPILMYDPHNRAIAAIHAGWKGTVGHIVTKTITAMKAAFGTDPGSLEVGIGPSISPAVYEVGEEVIEEVKKSFKEEDHLLLRSSEVKGKAKFNLWEANKLQLKKLGVKESNIELAGICTFSNGNQFFSARFSRESGRFAAGIKIV